MLNNLNCHKRHLERHKYQNKLLRTMIIGLAHPVPDRQLLYNYKTLRILPVSVSTLVAAAMTQRHLEMQ